jgi:hypothetical protein
MGIVLLLQEAAIMSPRGGIASRSTGNPMSAMTYAAASLNCAARAQAPRAVTRVPRTQIHALRTDAVPRDGVQKPVADGRAEPMAVIANDESRHYVQHVGLRFPDSAFRIY